MCFPFKVIQGGIEIHRDELLAQTLAVNLRLSKCTPEELEILGDIKNADHFSLMRRMIEEALEKDTKNV